MKALAAIARLNPLTELKSFLSGWCADLRSRRDYRNLLDGEAALDIARDIAAREAAAAQLAYTAEQADLEAARLLRESIADGHITAAEIPLLKKALTHITHSAEADHQIGEALA